MKNQAFFSSKDKSKKLKCHLLQFLFGALRVKTFQQIKSTIHNGSRYDNFGVSFLNYI